MVLDHVLVAVADLERAAADFETRYGLRSVAGGRHPGVGTANMIIPLGREYIELIAVVDADEAAINRRSRRVRRAVVSGATFATWAVRTSRLNDLRAMLVAGGSELPEEGSGARARPDGTVLRWRSQELSTRDEDVLPFVIEWKVPARMHPGRSFADHPSGATGIRHVVLGDPDPAGSSRRLDLAIGSGVSREIRRSARSGILEVLVATARGDLVVS